MNLRDMIDAPEQVMGMQEAVGTIHAGGPGSGCRGNTCGRKGGHKEIPYLDELEREYVLMGERPLGLSRFTMKELREAAQKGNKPEYKKSSTGDVVVYHGTTKDVIPSIMKKGLDPNFGESGGSVFVADSKKEARDWAKERVDSKKRDDNIKTKGAVLEIHLPKALADKMEDDTLGWGHELFSKIPSKYIKKVT